MSIIKVAEVVYEGEMSPFYCTWLHPEARLSPTEKDALVNGLTAALGATLQ
jgi:hypothetical protein